VTMGGFLVLDEDGEAINIPNGEVTIHPNGQIEIEGSMIATLGLANFESLADMRPFGHNLYTAIPEAIPTAFNGNVLQGVRESSNVNVVQEMVNMITISRAYEANARMISIQDETLQQAVNNIARM